jgi:hypothetical protein
MMLVELSVAEQRYHTVVWLWSIAGLRGGGGRREFHHHS